MARKRMIDPDFWSDESLGQCSPMERLLFMGLISQSDDEGRLRGNPALIRSQIFPYDDVGTDEADSMLDSLQRAGLIERYTVEGQAYIWLPGFAKHQTINKPTPSKLPGPESADTSQEITTPTPLPDNDGSPTAPLPPKRREEKRSKEKGSEGNTTRDRATPTPPTPMTAALEQPIEYVMALAEEMGQPFDEIQPKFKSRQCRHGKELQEQGHTVEQVRRCIRWLKSDDWWVSKGIDLYTVTNQIGKFELAGEPVTMQPRAAPGRNGRPREPDFSGIDAFDEQMSALEQRR